MEPKSNYTKAFPYEMFIRNAFNCDRGMNGGDVAYMKNLLDTEDGFKSSLLPKYEKQLEQIKKWMLKANDKYLKDKKITPVKKAKLEEAKFIINGATSSTALLNVISEHFEL